MGKSDYVKYDLSKLMESSNNLIISNGLLNKDDITTFYITNNGDLKRIAIGNDCYGKVRVLNLDGLSELESVVIGQRSFTVEKSDYGIIHLEDGTDGSCRIVNCPKLKTIQIGGNSFGDYHSIELNSLPSTQSIEINGFSFYWAPSFSLTGLIEGLV